MLSYRHGFHAGNFADVLKHWVLCHLLRAMQSKQRPFLYLDTHAGAGRYDLRSSMAQKLKEHETGILKLWQHPGLPESFEPYLDAVRAENPAHRLIQYPGSPALAMRLLRPQDRAVFCELHPAEQKALGRFCHARPKTQVALLDGLQSLKAFLPPKEARALVFMDPAYELDAEYRSIPQVLMMAQKRFAGGVFALWYPLLGTLQAQQLPGRIAKNSKTPVLCVELWVEPADRPSRGLGMYGSGVLVLNPPWRLEEQLAQGLEWLTQILGEGQGGSRLRWLVSEENLQDTEVG